MMSTPPPKPPATSKAKAPDVKKAESRYLDVPTEFADGPAEHHDDRKGIFLHLPKGKGVEAYLTVAAATSKRKNSETRAVYVTLSHDKIHKLIHDLVMVREHVKQRQRLPK